MPIENRQDLLSTVQVARVIGKTHQAVHNQILKGKIQATQFLIGKKRHYGIAPEEVDRLLKELQPPGWEALA